MTVLKCLSKRVAGRWNGGTNSARAFPADRRWSRCRVTVYARLPGSGVDFPGCVFKIHET